MDWCLEKKAFRIVTPNRNLGQSYLSKATNALRAMNTLDDNKEWQIPSAYYAMYYSVAAILSKLGVKSDNHACSIALFSAYFREHFTEEELFWLEKAREYRIDVQYNLVKEEQLIRYASIVPKAAPFYTKCQKLFQTDLKTLQDGLHNNISRKNPQKTQNH